MSGEVDVEEVDETADQLQALLIVACQQNAVRLELDDLALLAAMEKNLEKLGRILDHRISAGDLDMTGPVAVYLVEEGFKGEGPGPTHRRAENALDVADAIDGQMQGHALSLYHIRFCRNFEGGPYRIQPPSGQGQHSISPIGSVEPTEVVFLTMMPLV